MRIWGISDSSHDASLAVIEDGTVLLAAHSERYAKEKQTWQIHEDLWNEALSYGPPDLITYYERRILKRLRRWLYGGSNGEYRHLYRRHYLAHTEIQVGHHHSHAAAGYYTSPFQRATVVVLDAIGEFDTGTIWIGQGRDLRLVDRIRYPISLGLYYSAFTDLLGYQAGQDEYIVMGMAAYGDPRRYYRTISRLYPTWHQQTRDFHRAITDLDLRLDDEQARYDLAAAVQRVYEERLLEIMRYARGITGIRDLVYMGGCALNCSANRLLWDIWDRIWIMPNPGDAGSSLGSILAVTRDSIGFPGPYLGHDLGGPYPVDDIIRRLQTERIVPVASGRAEYGPRALGNRSILADPRDATIRDLVNLIKRREPFRPFAPVVREEDAHVYFDLDRPSPFMSYAVRCRRPDLIPAVVHADGTSRVQTVSRDQHPGLHEVLTRWDRLTGIPVLLNTSLNVRGEPMLNDRADITRWERVYGTEITTSRSGRL